MRPARPRCSTYGAFFADEHGHDRTITTFFLLALGDLAGDFGWLAARVASGALDPRISRRGDWTGLVEAAALIAGRRLHGKAVLDVA
ncbi:hypothetical protein [Amycolatopsis australiensis]|uniref:hypothetical protein n=1 Tax=Amycolatopsis australiensis TaxID=546364 RepID=UPI000931D8BF|nr:hypothetical protein [Amycolatopsis australiensis]